jgi:glycosyltransferase involved in cell wall biosynthesis
MNKPILLYFHPGMASFIQKDINIIEKEWNVITFEFKQKNKKLIIFEFLKQLIFLIKNIFKAEKIVCKFGGYHSFLPSLFGYVFKKPVLIFLAGYDCYSFPDIKYGVFSKKLFGKITSFSYKLSNLLLPVHESMITTVYTYYKTKYQNQGFLYFIPNLKTKIKTIYYGYEPEKFLNLNKKRIKNSFLTVARETSNSTFFRKGIDLILEVAPFFPDFQFTIIGKNEDIITPNNNVKMLPAVPYEELQEIYNSHEFYLQLSIAEGFPNALCEAMLCGCIPIGSDVFSIPFIIDNNELILKNRNIDELIKLLTKAVTLDKKELSKKAIERISNNFKLEMREKEILKTLKELK